MREETAILTAQQEETKRMDDLKTKLNPAYIEEYTRLHTLLQSQQPHIKQVMHDDFYFLYDLATSKLLSPKEIDRQLGIKLKEVKKKMDDLNEHFMKRNIKLLREKTKNRVLLFIEEYKKMKYKKKTMGIV